MTNEEIAVNIVTHFKRDERNDLVDEYGMLEVRIGEVLAHKDLLLSKAREEVVVKQNQLDSLMKQMMDERDKACGFHIAEIEKMRAALEDIEAHSKAPFMKVDPRNENWKWLNYMNDVASKALSSSPSENPMKEEGNGN
jgi:hypothetical protein